MTRRRTSWTMIGFLALVHCGDAVSAPAGGYASGEASESTAPAGTGAAFAPNGAGAQCASDADCDDRDPCTVDACRAVRAGELMTRTCAHTASASCSSDAGASPTAQPDAQAPASSPKCAPLAGTMSTMQATQSGNALRVFANVWCCIGRLNECAYPAGTCIAGQVTQTQSQAGAQCKTPGSGGSCEDDDAVWAVSCNATIACHIACDGTCVPEKCN